MKCDVLLVGLPSSDELTVQNKNCPVDWALRVVSTAADAACGHTTICRDGLNQIKTILTDIASGKGQSDDLMLLEDLCTVIVDDKDCAISVAAAEAVLFSLRSFTDDWEKHCVRKLCSSLICKGCYSVYIDPAVCNGCGACLSKVKDGVIAGGPGLIHVLKDDAAVKEGNLEDYCPLGAMKKAGAIKPQVPQTPVPVGTFAPTGGLRRKRNRCFGEEGKK